MSKRLIAALFGVVVIAVIAAGCGSSSDDSTSSTSGDGATLTKAEFIKQGDAICEEGNESIQKEAEEFADENDVDIEKPTTEQQEEVIEDVVAPGLTDLAGKLGDLGAPSGDEDEVEAIVAALESGAEEVEADASSLAEDNPLEEAGKLADKYGFKVCGGE